MKSNLLTLVIMVCLTAVSIGQDIKVKNPSFEGIARKGYIDQLTATTVFLLDGWEDCGMHKFIGESPPDIHPGNYWGKSDKERSNAPGINFAPSNGNTYLGMVARANDTYESVGQKLNSPLQEGQCYLFSIDLMRSPDYLSVAKGKGYDERNFSTPTVLRIYGSNSMCYIESGENEIELLAESAPVANTTWQQNVFMISPSNSYQYLTLEAFYQTPTTEAYLGHILLDNASNLIHADCESKPIDYLHKLPTRK